MAKKKKGASFCPHGRFIRASEPCVCLECKLDRLLADGERPLKTGEFVEIIRDLRWQLEQEIDDVRPVEYDPQCE
jgi:hypothetical protein